VNRTEATQEHGRAAALFRHGDYAESLAVLDKLDAAFPQNADILYARARCLGRLGCIKEALELCDRLTKTYRDPRGVTLSSEIWATNENTAEDAVPKPPRRIRIERAWPRRINPRATIAAVVLVAAVILNAVLWHLRLTREPEQAAALASIHPIRHTRPVLRMEERPWEPPPVSPLPASIDPVALVDTRRYDIHHTVTFGPENGDAYERASVQIPIPAQHRHQRIVGRPKIRIRPIQNRFFDLDKPSSNFGVVRTAPFGALVVYVSLDGSRNTEEYTVEILYSVDVSNLSVDRAQLDLVAFRELDKLSPDIAAYLRPESLAESERDEVKAVVRAIFPSGTRGGDSVVGAAEKIYEWVLDHCDYQLKAGSGQAAGLIGAVETLRARKGECGEYTALFVALCRAAGIPARGQTGYWANRPDAPHVWAEFYLPGFEWIPVDPSMGDKAPRGRYFAQLPDLNRRVTVTHGFDHLFGRNRLEYLQEYAYAFTYTGRRPQFTGNSEFMARSS
jgi:transglutaminase-like putative cysteine protease